MTEVLPYSTQWITEDDIDAVADVLRHGWLTGGARVDELEERFAEYCGARYAVAVANGTAALHLLALAMGLGEGDTLLTTPITFVATANCARFCGADVVFADVRRDTVTLDPERLREALASHDGVKVVAPVDFGGSPADLAEIRDIADEYGALVLEDACHAPGATYDVEGATYRVGECAHSDAAIFSLHPVKHFTSGEGGIVTTNDPRIAQAIRDLRSHGITRDRDRLIEDHGPWYYEMQSLGYNYRITDFQCALGTSQLARMPEFVRRRQEIAARYDARFADVAELELVTLPDDRRSSYHLYTIRVVDGVSALDRRQLFDALREHDIACQVHYAPVHLQPYYREYGGFAPGDFPVAEDYYNRCLSIPCFPRMTDDDVDRVADTIVKLVTRA